MKKRSTAAAGAVITVVLLLISVLNPDLAMQLLPGENRGVYSTSPIKVPEEEGIKPGSAVHAKVTRIVDGDTLEVKYDNTEYTVRLLCIDTPETKKKGVAVQPYGEQAEEKLTELVLNRNVVLVFEKDTDDRYDRLLAYIIREDGVCANTVLVEQGYARADIVRPNNVYADYFYELQEKAVEGKSGLWSLPAEKQPFVKNDKGYYVPRYVDDAA